MLSVARALGVDMAKAWRLAKSLDTLRAEVNAAAPYRSKRSDGTKGDDAHAKRKSHHNPDSKGVVTALDLTHDPAGGFDSYAFAEWMVKHAKTDPRISEVISNGRIATAAKGWKWRPYNGPNSHSHHVHVSATYDPKLYDETTPFGFQSQGEHSAHLPTLTEAYPVLAKGVKGKAVERIQKLLGVDADGWFGDKTEKAVIAFQRAHKLHADGIVGPYTWDALERER